MIKASRMPDADALLEVKNLRIAFAGDDPFEAVKDISFSLAKGATLAIVGESGSGKSLTALALMGLLPKGAALSGHIELHTGTDNFSLQSFSRNSWQQYRGKAAGIVFQEPMSALNPVMTIGAQLAESITAHKSLSKKEQRALLQQWLENVQLTPTLADRFPHQLSGGQKQRVMIAIAMCQQPALVIADEPTTALDVTVQAEVLALMRSLQQKFGTGYLFITHDLALAAEFADEVLVLYKGETVEYGAAKEVLLQPAHPYTQALIACRPASHKKGERLPVVNDFLSGNYLVHSKSIQPVTPQKSSGIPAEKILEVNGLEVWYPQKGKEPFKAVNSVSFNLMRGEILGLAGESGCGKSTLGKALMGLTPISGGSILFHGKNISKLDRAGWKAIRRSMQLIFQDPFSSLNPRLTIGESILEPMVIHKLAKPPEAREELSRLLDAVGLPADAAKRYPHQFSGGQRQRIGIARALALKPQVLVCDESVSALDVSVQAQILNLLKDLQHDFGLTYLFISHDLGVMRYLCDRIMIMQAGRIVETGSTEDVMQRPTHPYTQKLLSAIPAFAGSTQL